MYSTWCIPKIACRGIVDYLERTDNIQEIEDAKNGADRCQNRYHPEQKD